MEKSALGKESWYENFNGWLITDCAVRNDGMIYLCARKNIPHEQASRMHDHDIPTRIININLKKEDPNNWGHQELEGMALPVLGVCRPPFEPAQGMVAAKNSNGDVFPRGSGLNGPMEHIAPGARPFPKRLKCINGYTWAVCTGRRLYKRIAVGRWELQFQGVPDDQRDLSQGFTDLDAFSETDMYAVGGHGDVWHFDGKAWKQMGFPSNVQLGTVTCAGDGKVYITGEGGSMWVGRESSWKKVYSGGASILWNDVLWFQGKLWLASDYQFMIWDGKQMDRPQGDPMAGMMRGHMDAYQDLLVIASPTRVMSFDGKVWRTIVEPYA